MTRVIQLGGREVRVATPVTFTPFASARPCSARCVFCSETLVPYRGATLSAALRPIPGYFDALARVLASLRGLEMGLSLSGLEATDDSTWLLGVLQAALDHLGQGGQLGERVLYTNAAGLEDDRDGERVLVRLAALRLTRAEVSRHHPLEDKNQAIMRFRPGVAVRAADVFERTIRRVLDHVPVRLVCLVQRAGVERADDVMRYLEWARELGVRDVVFREASRLPPSYVANRTLRVIEATRISMDTLLAEVLARRDVTPEGAAVGYYYANVQARYGDTRVTFEASDYGVMKERHGSDTVHKLVFHANGNLSADWDPEGRVLLRAAHP